MKNRLKNNLQILEKLESYFEANPEIRFFQGLWNTNIIQWNRNKSNSEILDKHSEEPNITLENLKIKLNENRKL